MTIVVIGLYGVFNNYSVKHILISIQQIFVMILIMVNVLKMMTITCNAEELWDLLNVSHESFLSSNHCKKYFHKLIERGKLFERTYFLLVLIYGCTTISWIIMPRIMSTFNVNEETQNIGNSYKFCIINFRYPVSLEDFNKYFDAFYLIEMILALFNSYGFTIFDLFITVILELISTQYEIVSTAYTNLEVIVENESGE